MELIGTNEIADMLGVKPGTVHQWRQRRQFPDAEWVVSGTPVWRRETIIGWAERGGRQIAETLAPHDRQMEELNTRLRDLLYLNARLQGGMVADPMQACQQLANVLNALVQVTSLVATGLKEVQ